MQWTQVYDPLGQPLLSSLVAGAPIAVLLGLLLWGVSAPRAAAAGLAVALAVALLMFRMPVSAALAAIGYGGCFGLMPIGWIVLPALFLFHLTVRSGQFEVLKQSITAVSPDRRMQALLIAFCFGTLLEGAAGFGMPVAICAALMIGIGFSPLVAAAMALLANTAPVAFGSLGIPIITLAKYSGLDEMALSQMAGRQLTVFSLIIPAWLVVMMSGWRGLRGCWPAVLICGVSYSSVQFVMSNYHGPMLVSVMGGLSSMVAMVLLLRFWQPREIWRFPEEGEEAGSREQGAGGREQVSGVRGQGTTDNGQRTTDNGQASGGETREVPSLSPDPRPLTPVLGWRRIVYAWMPWLVLVVMVFLWSSMKESLDGGRAGRPNALHGISKVSVGVPWLEGVVYRTRPVVEVPEGSDRAAAPEAAVFDFNWLSATGTGLFLAAVLSAFWLRIGPRAFVLQFAGTLFQVRWALLTIACMLALASVTKYSGADATLGLVMTRTGWLYPLFAPMLGWLGVAATGSDTAANALFGSLQRITAEQLKLNATLIVASNSTGGMMGKMISAQTIVVAAAATEQSGGEGRILRFVFLHSLALALLVGLLTLAQAYVLTWMVP
jgi:lactate permease